MAKSREEVQDIALYHMEKLSRRVGSERENRVVSLAEQLSRAEGLANQSTSQMDFGDWREALQRKLKENRKGISGRAFEFVTRKYRKQLEEIKDRGSWNEAFLFVEEKAIEWMNI